MIWFLQLFEESISSLFPLLGLFTICMIGYYFALHDFKPKAVSPNEKDMGDSNKVLRPQMKPKVLSNQELGIDDLRQTASLPPETQRRLQKEQMIREYSAKSPDEAASVIRGWLVE